MEAAMVVLNEPDRGRLSAQDLRHHWHLYLIEGIVLVLLGIGALIIPAFASLAVAIFLGWLFVIGGIVGLATSLSGRHAAGSFWSLASSIVTVAAGGLILVWPAAGAFSLTIVIAAYLVADGFIMMMLAIEHRRRLASRWSWLFLNGALDVVLAVLIVWLLPQSALWVLGLIVGIDFLFGGGALIAVALAARVEGTP
jgi:uncharacterized membrane protein HdeD (DUF308 family)